MAGKRDNALRAYHLLVVREPDGFSWQVRYGRNAQVIERSAGIYLTHAQAAKEGEQVMSRLR